MRAIVAGGTGLVGSALLEELAHNGVPALAVARSAGSERPGLLWSTAQLANLKAAHVPPGTDVAFCALGTTIRKAGSQEAFRAVDHGLVLAFARACRKAGVPTLAVVSAAGANPRSRIFYSRVKGEVERDLAALRFPSLVLLRPSLLLGERSEPRVAERIGTAVAKALRPVLPASVRGVRAETVARALVVTAREARPGVRIVGNAEIALLGHG